MVNWDAAEKVEVPSGAYVGWGSNPGQVVSGKVLSFDLTGAQDFNGGACPLLSLELLDAAQSHSKKGAMSFNAGDLVNITCGQVNLKKAVRQADPQPGDLIRIELASMVPTDKGDVKVFDVKILRGGGGAAASTPTPAAQPAQAAPAAAADTPPAGFTAEQWAGMDADTRSAVARMAGQ